MGVVKRTDEEVFCENSIVSQETLRNHYKKLNNEYICSLCGISSWRNQELTLRLDHINGNNHDNRLENLRWLCPNCDSQQDTYCGKNKRHYEEPLKRYCKECGVELSKNSTVNYCQEHWRKIGQRVVKNRPDRETLKQLIRTESFTKIGAKYSVCDNTIRKWCDGYQLPKKKLEINKISNEDWELI